MIRLFTTLILLLTASTAFADELSAGDTTWILVSSALVLLMLPGLALFYGGMVRAKSTLSAFLYSFSALCVVGVTWAVVGFTIAFGASESKFFGSMQYFMLGGDFMDAMSGTIPLSIFAMFQGMFAIITVALISGAIVERMKFSAWLLFMPLWIILVYSPVAYWVWGGGWLGDMGALDFAGGTVVHFSSGMAALAIAIVLGNRKDFMKAKILPHNVTYTVLGAGILWFGWFGFNAGSALAADKIAALAFVNTMIAAAAGGLSWMLIEMKSNKPSALGIASGIVAGLVGITPAAGFVEPWAALVIGAMTGALCFWGITLKFKFKLDDSLDVFGIHGLGGLFGALATGVFATVGAKGLLAGNAKQVWIQLVDALGCGVYSFVVTLIIALAIKHTLGMRITPEEETEGTDVNQHGEKAYNFF
ncbi:MAG: ammonia channel protein [Denitrovibrio sp.]|mgnify:CR=1 FL=1|nr:MAG: ammonia channel protein [Denitrovibrio sp.]